MEVTGVFGPGGSVLVSDVHCTGIEPQLHLCQSNNHSCDRDDSAGVICSRSFGKYIQTNIHCSVIMTHYTQIFPGNVVTGMAVCLRIKTQL